MTDFSQILRESFKNNGITDAHFSTHPFLVRVALKHRSGGPVWGFHCPLEAWAFYDKQLQRWGATHSVEFVDVSEDWCRLNGESP